MTNVSSKSHRKQTGIEGLDVVLNGGLIPKRTYLLLGTPGVGKTLTSLHFLRKGVELGERCLCVNLIEPSDTMRSNVESFGWNLDDVNMLDLTDTSTLADSSYGVFSPGEVEQDPIFQRLYSAIEEHKPERLVIDSVTQLGYVTADHYQFRRRILDLMLMLSKLGCTTLMTHEPSKLAEDIYTGLAVDGIIRLRRELSQFKIVEVRSVEVQKFRGSSYRPGIHFFRITDTGVNVYPHGEIRRRSEFQEEEQLKSGIEALDNLLGGGLELGTTTLISGPTGVGKSTMVAQFMSQAVADRGLKCLYLSFEEAPSSIYRRNQGLGIPLEEQTKEGKIQLSYIHPRQFYPDELNQRVRQSIENGVQVVALDGIRGYEFAMEPYGSPLNSLNNLLAEIASKGVTILLTNEVEVIAGGELKATETGASHMCDNLILMRYSEYRAEVIKLIGCLKKRLSPFEPELRRVVIKPAPDGLQVGPRLKNLKGILTGVPTLADKDESITDLDSDTE